MSHIMNQRGMHGEQTESQEPMAHEIREQKLQAELDRFVSIVGAELRPQLIILFGSVAQGTVGEWSDLDIVVVMETELPFRDRLRLIHRLVGSELALDVIPYTPSEWDEIKETRPFVRDEIVRKGRVVYDGSNSAVA